MKKRIGLAALLAALWSVAVFAAGTRYVLRVDGLACPFCAYGIEKKLIRTEGVEAVDMDLAQGQVIVKVRAGAELGEARLERLVDEAGFTLRSVEVVPQ
ncbi:MAG TPA: copper chaperone [Gammaproteobacteria bacterium]|nr:copper chaperone [Gammaproteobacteria bacterium]